VIFDMSMSLDGYIRAANPRPEEPLGDGGEALHGWAMGGPATGTRFLPAGVVDELSIHLVPVLFGAGARTRDARSSSTSHPNHREEAAMRFMVLVPGSRESEAGEMPSTAELEAMTKYNEELVKAGVMLAGDGLHPTSKGARVRFDGRERTVIDGPFTEARELVAGYWIWECASRDEAIEWLKRAPFDGGVEIELRQVFEAEDFGEQLTPELRDTHARLREQVEAQD
jgi:hypothetical protein